MGGFYFIYFLNFVGDFVCGQKCRVLGQTVLPFSFFKNIIKSLSSYISSGDLALGVVPVLNFPLKSQSV